MAKMAALATLPSLSPPVNIIIPMRKTTRFHAKHLSI